MSDFLYEIERELARDDIGMNGSTSNGRAEQKKKALIELMSTVEEEQVDFLWRGRIPRGRLTLFDGDPGVGKSYTALAIAATLSRGDALPFDAEPEAPLRSLIISAEDGPADTIKPRLRMLKADMDFVGIPERSMNLMPSQINANLVDRMLQEFPAAYLVLDPILAYASRKNTDKAGDVRDLLQPLAGLAEKHKVAIVLIRHLNKGTQNKALYRGQGSVDFAAICRSMFIFAQDPEDGERRLMAHSKSSVAGLQPTLEFFIRKDSGLFVWGGETNESADEALGGGDQPKQRERVQQDRAKRFLEETLANGPLPTNELKDRADKAGIAWRTIWRAAETMNITRSKERATGAWWWRLT